MKLYDNGLIGSEDPKGITLWRDGDDLDFFNSNLISQPDEWAFRKKTITYSINSNGHRSKEIDELDLNNYILVAGCSHTAGIGMAIEDCYPNLIAKRFNLDYYNLGMSATGIDVLVHNLVVWFTLFKNNLPKFVIIQWPDETRILTGNNPNLLRTMGVWQNNSKFNDFVNLGYDIKYFSCRNILYLTLIKKIITVPFINLSMGKPNGMENEEFVNFVITDFARDLSHGGFETQKKITNDIYNSLINTQCLSFYQNTEQKN